MPSRGTAAPCPGNLDSKHEALQSLLRNMEGVVIAFSGGVDSSLVCRVAWEQRGSQALAVTGVSESLPGHDYQDAQRVVRDLGIRHQWIRTKELGDTRYASNPANRCYFCKDELYRCLWDVALQEGLSCVVDGQNLDDLEDHRPGTQAAREQGVRSPLQEAGFTKADVRTLARALGLPVWDKPASPCLASRIPHGTRIIPEALRRVDQAETYLRSLGFREVRVRDDGNAACIEVEPGALPRLQGVLLERVRHRLDALGYDRVEVEPEGYRQGRMSENSY